MVDLASGIEAGSTEYGDRQVLEAGLATLPSGTQGGAPAPVGAPAGGGSGPLAGPVDPLGALATGTINPNEQGLLTDGLSVGPGTMPPGTGADDPVKVRLREIATEARSPVLRALARNELRRLTRQAKL